MDGLGKGIAVAGIWLGVGVVGIWSGDAVAPVAMFAMIASIFTAVGC